jgi:hypothetical protein
MGMRRRLLDDFVMEFDYRFSQHVQHGGTTCGQVIVTPPPFAFSHSDFRPQPPITLKAFQQWIERTWTDVIAVPAQFGEHPLTDDWMLCGVMQDVHLPKAQQDLSGQQLRIRGGHEKSPPDGYYDVRKRI